ncbi:MAG: arsenic efflux protein, partial [Eggerthellaceae bacterium]|nr:arsenic efflux protein [Eggerthellaceae bacterium]
MNELHAHNHGIGQEPIEVIVQHILGHSIGDVLYLIPFLFVTYLAMEWLEHKTGTKTQEAISHAGAAGPVIGALLGAVPQCGFSAAAAALYAGRVVTLGTVFAVFLSTSDEMLPIFIAEQVPVQTIAKVLGTKIIIGMLMGFIVDAALRLLRRDKQELLIHELCERDDCDCGPSPNHPQVHNHA